MFFYSIRIRFLSIYRSIEEFTEDEGKECFVAVELMTQMVLVKIIIDGFQVSGLLIMFLSQKQPNFLNIVIIHIRETTLHDTIEQPPGAGLVVPKTTQLDEDFFVYGSDLMLCWDFAQTSCQDVALLPVQFVHLRGQGGTSSSPDLADWLRVESAKGFALFFAKSGQLSKKSIWVMSYGILEFCGLLRFIHQPAQRNRRKKRLWSFIFNR